LIGGEGVLSGGVIAGDGEVVGLAGGQGLDSGGGGIARIEGLGVKTCGSAVMDVVADHGGIGVRVPGQGDALGGLGQGQGANQERGDAEPQSGAPEKREWSWEQRFRSDRIKRQELSHVLIITLIMVITSKYYNYNHYKGKMR
jgi:hypothetical protein